MKDVTIGLFNDGYVPIMDGVTLTVRNYAYWLNRTMGPTYVITPFVPRHIDEEPFPVIRFLSLPTVVRPPYRIGIPDIDVKLQVALKKRNFSLVHAHSPFSAGQMAYRVAKERRIPMIATFHSKYRDDFARVVPIKPLVDAQIKRIVDFYYSADHVWVPQESVAKTLREYGYKGPYEVVENGIDLRPPANIEPYYAAGLKELGIPEGMPVGLFVGQHILEKNLEFLMKSLPAAMDAVPDFRMVFVGQGYAKQQLMDLAKSLGIRDKVIFHDVVYNREVLKSIYARADLFLFPSIYDNAPLVVREAAAFRTPGILLEGATAAEIIRDGENGFLSANSVESYSERIVSVLKDRSLLEKAGYGAQRTLCRTWEDVVREVRDRYLSILSHWAS